MAEKLEIRVERLQIEGLQSGSIPVNDFLNQLFADQHTHAAMCLALKEYHRNDGGSPEVDGFEVVNIIYDARALNGSFRCKFKVNYHYTCSDVRNNAMDTIDWRFKLDQDHRMLLLTGEETLERDFNEF
jgi:hypothetical protein